MGMPLEPNYARRVRPRWARSSRVEHDCPIVIDASLFCHTGHHNCAGLEQLLRHGAPSRAFRHSKRRFRWVLRLRWVEHEQVASSGTGTFLAVRANNAPGLKPFLSNMRRRAGGEPAGTPFRSYVCRFWNTATSTACFRICVSRIR